MKLWRRIVAEYDVEDCAGIELLTQACQVLIDVRTLRLRPARLSTILHAIAATGGPTMRGLLTLAYCLISILTAGQVMFRSSLSVGVSALAASALGFFGTATFFGSYLARREKKYSALDLLGIGAIALALVAAAFGLMVWSGFYLSLDGLLIPGPYWVVVGLVTALLVTTKQHAL